VLWSISSFKRLLSVIFCVEEKFKEIEIIFFFQKNLGQKLNVQCMLLWPNSMYLNQFKPVQQFRQQALRAYCPNLYTVPLGWILNIVKFILTTVLFFIINLDIKWNN
jgi:hypothetical protein